MVGKTLLVAVSVLAVSACESYKDSKNIYRQPVVLGYTSGANPQPNGDLPNLIPQALAARDPAAPATAALPAPVPVGQCVSIYLHGGETNTDSENAVQRAVARATRDKEIVSQWAISASVVQGAITSDSFKSETTIFRSNIRFKLTESGVLGDPKHLGLHDVPIFGPVKWTGLPISVRLTMSELDQEAADRFQNTLSSSSEKLRTQLGLPQNATAEAVKAAIAKGLDAVVKLSTGAYVAIGLEAAKFTAEMYNALHAPDDIYIDETIGLVPGQDRGAGAMALRPGIYTLIRVGGQGERRDLSNATLNVRYQTLEAVLAGRRDTPIWLAFRVVSSAPIGGNCPQN